MSADPTPLVVVLLGVVLLAGIATALARDLLVLTVVFGAYSLALAVLWVVFRAPDVGLTEAAVGAGVTTSLLLVTVAHTGTSAIKTGAPADETGPPADETVAAADETGVTAGRTDASADETEASADGTGVSTAEPVIVLPRRPGAVAAGAGLVAALGLTLPALPAVGDPSAPAFASDAAATFYLDTAGAFGVDNVVTAVLVVFRGFDTFGEVGVVFAAAVAVLAVVGREVT